MMPEDRPDGKKPFGFPSLLDYYLHLEENTQPDHPALDLNPDACMALLQKPYSFITAIFLFPPWATWMGSSPTPNIRCKSSN
jgi:hypothetical protein